MYKRQTVKNWSFEHFGDSSNNGTGDSVKMYLIHNWGEFEVASYSGGFYNCFNLTGPSANDTPTFTADSTLKNFFRDCMRSQFSSNASNWANWNAASGMGNVTSFEGMFRNCRYFNGNVDNFDTSGATKMSGMFRDCWEFNQNLNSSSTAWDVSNVEDFDMMFTNCYSFNGYMVNWNTSSAKNFNTMFWNATSFNRSIGGWNVSSVTNMTHMFRGATAFNQTLNGWNTSAAIHLGSMFWGAASYNQPMSNWNTANVTDMENMFREAVLFNQDLATNGDKWNVSKVVSMLGMFQAASVYMDFNGSLAGWNTPALTNMDSMFYGCNDFNQPIDHLDVADVTDMDNLFGYCSSFNQDLSSWDVSSVTTATNMFYPNVAFSPTNRAALNDTAWTTNSVTNAQLSNISVADLPFITVWRIGDADYGDGDLTLTLPLNSDNINATVDWGDGTVEALDSKAAGNHTYSSAGDYTVTISVYILGFTFLNGAANVQDRNKLIDIKQWGQFIFSYAGSVGGSFYGCSKLVGTATDTPWYNGQNTLHADMSGTFAFCPSLEGGVSGWASSKITKTSNMFFATFDGSFNG